MENQQPTNQELENVMSQVKSPPNADRFQLWSVKDIIERDFGEDKWMVERLIPYEGITIVSGESGSYKSWITQEIAKCVSLGKPFLGKFKTIQGSVIMVDEENHPSILKERIGMLNIPNNASIYYISLQRMKVDVEGETEHLLEVAKSVNAKLIVFDSLVRIHLGNENDSGGMAFVFEQFKRLTKEGMTVICTHHNRKATSNRQSVSHGVRGSSDIIAAIDCHIAIEKRGNEVTVIQNKMRIDKELNPFKILANIVDQKMILEYAGIAGQLKTQKDKAEDIIPKLFDSGELTRDNINQKLERLGEEKKIKPIGSDNIRKALESLEENGAIKVRTGRSNTKYYSLAQKENNNEESQEQTPTINENELWQPELGIGIYANEKDEPF